MEQVGFLGSHGNDTQLGVIGIGGTGLVSDVAVEAFQAADRAQVFAVPARGDSFQVKVGDGQPEVTAQGSYGEWLGLSVGTDDLEIAAQGGGIVVRLPDSTEVFEDGPATAAVLLWGQGGRQADGV